jgi:hypothetical protein
MEMRVETAPLTCRTCGQDLEPDSARSAHRPPALIETGFMDLRGLPEPPRDSPAPWRR